MKWYEELFRNYSKSYENETFTHGTSGEVDFIENEIHHDRTVPILDIGCGTGRHAIELAGRGYSVTGVDLSVNMLAKAREKTEKPGLKIKFMQCDAREPGFNDTFGLVTMICEGAFPLMETDEMNYAILKNAAAALKENGVFIFTTLNGLCPLFHSVQDIINNGSVAAKSRKNAFDLMTFRDYSEYVHIDDDGKESTLQCNERYYVPSEITWLLKSPGFASVEIFGCG